MGFFSWNTADTGKSVSNNASTRGALPCQMLLPDGRRVTERDYAGYGVFGGLDFFEEVARANGCTGDDLRQQGIDLYYDGDSKLPVPKIVSINCTTAWEKLPRSEDCDYQGFFYGGEDDDDDEEESDYIW